jgi:hypothetical protein
MMEENFFRWIERMGKEKQDDGEGKLGRNWMESRGFLFKE